MEPNPIVMSIKEDLQVVRSSIFPKIPNAEPHSSTIVMQGCKTDIISEKALIHPSSLKPTDSYVWWIYRLLPS